jgi:CheY-like chemotaxis protein
MNCKKILVVDDDLVTQKIIGDILVSAGYQVVSATDAASAVNAARSEQPDLITLDVLLPADSPTDSMDGLKLARWLQRLHPEKKIPTIIISGLDPGELIEEAAAVGAYTFLPKPFDKTQLLAAVTAALK